MATALRALGWPLSKVAVCYAVQEAGVAERDMVPKLPDQAKERYFRPKMVGADKNYDTCDCIGAMRERRVTANAV